MELDSLQEKPKKTIENDLFGRPIRSGKKQKNGKAEGNKNERAAADWTGKWTGVKFIRTPSSGGRRLTNNSTFCGDIVCEDEDFDFVFSLETKHLERLSLREQLVKNSVVYTIWEQALADAKRARKLPMLLLRKIGMGKNSFVLFVSKEVAQYLLLEGVPIACTGKGKYELYGFKCTDVLDVSYEKYRLFLKKLNYI